MSTRFSANRGRRPHNPVLDASRALADALLLALASAALGGATGFVGAHIIRLAFDIGL